MKKYLLLISAILTLPALPSCGGINGDPKHDAEAFEGLLEKRCELDLEHLEKETEYKEYYIEKEGVESWEDFQKEYQTLEDKYKDEKEYLLEKIKEKEEEMEKNNKD